MWLAARALPTIKIDHTPAQLIVKKKNARAMVGPTCPDGSSVYKGQHHNAASRIGNGRNKNPPRKKELISRANQSLVTKTSYSVY